MTFLEKVDIVREFVRKRKGYPAAWARALPNLDKAVELIQKNPQMTLNQFLEKMNITQE